MRTLLLLRGAPGCGKTTWIRSHGLSNYALSADAIRMMCAAPELMPDGNVGISQKHDGFVWTVLFQILEVRMQNGEFVVIDATNSKTADMNRYKKLADKYRYRIFCVDMTGVPIEEVKKRNMMRVDYKRVPEKVIDNMYSRFKTQKIPAGIKAIQPDELDSVWFKKIDLTGKYRKIHVLGDIHGCNTALQEYLAENGGIKPDEFYLFCGDYIDRGLENAEVIQWMLSVYENPNVMFLEGNHEQWLWCWANEEPAKSREFEFRTKKQLEDAGISKKDVRKLYRSFAQCAYFDYGKNAYFVTHGGLSRIPVNLTFVATEQLFKGTGAYGDEEQADDAFVKNTQNNVYQIHGHRNLNGAPVLANERCVNLEGGVEFGGQLRAVQLDENGICKTAEIQNTVFKEKRILPQDEKNMLKSVGDMVLGLRQNRFVQEKQYGNISSFNFTRDAFYDKVWNLQTMKARGLYVNIPEQRIVARSYKKFFNVEERDETKLDALKDSFVFPVTAYIKENGFLGLVSYNDETDELFIATKSSPEGEFKDWLEQNMNSLIPEQIQKEIKEYAKENNVTFVFECVDTLNDPHVIEYPHNELILLDIVYNEIKFRKLPYAELLEAARKFGLKAKRVGYTFYSWTEFLHWYNAVVEEDYRYKGAPVEGFVVEDSNGMMVKVKTGYYNFWKYMRSISAETINKGYIMPNKFSSLTTPLANYYYGWLKNLREKMVMNGEDISLLPRDICSLRKMFYQASPADR